jgi:hypothetical protein
VSYALVFVNEFKEAFAQLDPAVQEVVLDDFDEMAERAAEALIPSARSSDPSIQVHRHEGVVEGVAFKVDTWLRLDHQRKLLVAGYLIDRLAAS